MPMYSSISMFHSVISSVKLHEATTTSLVNAEERLQWHFEAAFLCNYSSVTGKGFELESLHPPRRWFGCT
jgi:hypothetical protein